ncbi:MAG: DNA repair protein RecN [gamma proteobacterium symbiont of Bathyaustriella thionipta]|nr:DNA repair protein RecN [gamma proteobacterium symbiont of Bathyaustriella thionipta]
MLSELHIRDLAIINRLTLELQAGMTTLTGETGAGKSILIDALGLALGNRTDNSMIRQGADKAEISARFDIENNSAVQHWLKQQDHDSEELILRRILARNGKSRAYINGQPVPIASLQQVGELLIDILGQHAHQALLRSGQQRHLLDRYANLHEPLAQIHHIYKEHQNLQQQVNQLREAAEERLSRQDLLQYQIEELGTHDISAQTIRDIDQQQRKLSHIEQLIRDSAQISQLLEDEQGIQSRLAQASRSLNELSQLDESLQNSNELLESALIQTQEAAHSLRQYHEQLQLDPAQLDDINHKLETLQDLARKYRVKPDELEQKLASLQQELAQLDNSNHELQQKEKKLQALHTAYWQLAAELAKKRQQAAAQLSLEITQSMQQLGMDGGTFQVQISQLPDDKLYPWGPQQIDMRVSANPGQAAQAINKVASGGELSRISLAIQVATIRCNPISTLIFDEVDVGIGGATAEVVGQLLRQLGEQHQVLTVTHLPQVAAQGHQQLKVSKRKDETETRTQIARLDDESRIHEIARMLGGVSITEQTLAHAKEMIQQAAICQNLKSPE